MIVTLCDYLKPYKVFTHNHWVNCNMAETWKSKNSLTWHLFSPLLLETPTILFSSLSSLSKWIHVSGSVVSGRMINYILQLTYKAAKTKRGQWDKKSLKSYQVKLCLWKLRGISWSYLGQSYLTDTAVLPILAFWSIPSLPNSNAQLDVLSH